VIRRDPRDARFVFFEDPHSHQWHTLRWTGLPPEGEVPCFNDARVRELLAEARRCRLRPRSDRELLPVLLQLVGAHIPVAQWPTQMSRQQRSDHTREVAQGRDAARDRPGTPGDDIQIGPTESSGASVVRARFGDRAHRVGQAVADERRQRREVAVADIPQPPARLGAALRRRSVLVVPDDDDGETG
jgi:hypothetical protein